MYAMAGVFVVIVSVLEAILGLTLILAAAFLAHRVRERRKQGKLAWASALGGVAAAALGLTICTSLTASWMRLLGA